MIKGRKLGGLTGSLGGGLAGSLGGPKKLIKRVGDADVGDSKKTVTAPAKKAIVDKDDEDMNADENTKVQSEDEEKETTKSPPKAKAAATKVMPPAKKPAAK